MTDNLIQENKRRLSALSLPYNPLTGEGCLGPRTDVWLPGNKAKVSVPTSMTADPAYRRTLNRHEFDGLRMRHDFEFWCATCATVKDKAGCRDVRLTLNAAQRTIFAVMESQRRERKPIRIILLKARQCGGSTVVQLYMAWIQLLHRDNWHSLICAHVKDAAMTIKGMMSKLLACYPAEFLPEGCEKMKSFEGSRNTSRLGRRSNTLTICSAENQEAARGKDIAMAHLSEVAFWRTSAGHDPNNIIRSIAGSVALTPDTLLAIESTANGVGNYFHEEWLRAEAGQSDKQAVFVPWYACGLYSLPVTDYGAFWATTDDYERGLWNRGLTLEQIAWYHEKRREYTTHRAMQAEYPSTAGEAFTATDRNVFDNAGVDRLRLECREPLATGEVCGNAVKGRDSLLDVRFMPVSNGRLKVWAYPAAGSRSNRYVVVVDIGGRSDSSDYSVVAVIDRDGEDGRPAVAAQWRGHTDHDLLAWKAAQIARYYGNALLVVESNTIETEMTEGENSAYIMEEIADFYPNLYYRHSIDRLTGSRVSHIGFHTNRMTKPLIVNHHIATVRDGGYRECDREAVDEHVTYERKRNGAFGAKDGCHDDILMTRCIGLFVISELDRHAGADITPLKRPKWM